MIYKSENLRPTKQMITTLMDIHEREIMEMEPIDVALCLSTAGLMRRGFVATKKHSTSAGKEYMAVQITWKGKQFLSRLA